MTEDNSNHFALRMDNQGVNPAVITHAGGFQFKGNMTNDYPKAGELAVEFCNQLVVDLTPSQLAEVVKRNKNEPIDGVCHSHDFIDANVTMESAWNKLTSMEWIANDEAANAIVNQAWTFAAVSEFNPQVVARRI